MQVITYMLVWMCISMDLCICVYMSYRCICIQVFIYMLVWMCICMDVCICVCISNRCMYTSDYVYVISRDVYFYGSLVFLYVYHINLCIQVIVHTVLYHDDLCRVQKRWAWDVGGTMDCVLFPNADQCWDVKNQQQIQKVCQGNRHRNTHKAKAREQSSREKNSLVSTISWLGVVVGSVDPPSSHKTELQHFFLSPPPSPNPHFKWGIVE